MTTKHTPEPWKIQTVYEACCANAAAATFVSTGIPENQAKLIARAPDLLAENDRLRAVNAELVETSERLANWAATFTKGGKYRGHYIGQMRAAIAKAKGQP